MVRQNHQQSIFADRGSTIENVTQIIYAGKDQEFSSEEAKIIPNRINEKQALSIAETVLISNFWKPIGIRDTLKLTEIFSWNVPIWRLRGEVSASWTVNVEKTVGNTDNEQKQIVQEYEGVSPKSLDWIVSAHSPVQSHQRAIFESIKTVNSSPLSVRVDWQDYPFGEFLEYPKARLYAFIFGRSWRLRLKFDQGTKLLVDQSLREDLSVDAETPLLQLEPDVSLVTAKERAERHIHDYIWYRLSKAEVEIKDLRSKPEIDNMVQYWLPLWVVEYKYVNGKYHVVINGNNGKIIYGLLPLSVNAKIFASVISTLLIGLPIWTLSFFIYSLYDSTPIDSFNRVLLVIMVVLPFVITCVRILWWWFQHEK